MDVKEFDYSYVPVSRLEGGDARRFSCAIASVEAMCPALAVEPETFLTTIADRGTLRDVEFESERFNRIFRVRCANPEFAHALIDAQMMEWLMDLKDLWGFEVSGKLALAYAPREQPWEVATVLETLRGFIERIPSVVASKYRASVTEGPDGV